MDTAQSGIRPGLNQRYASRAQRTVGSLLEWWTRVACRARRLGTNRASGATLKSRPPTIGPGGELVGPEAASVRPAGP